MTQAELATLKWLNASTTPDWQHLDYRVAKKLDDSIPYIGKIQITSTTGGTHTSGSMHYKGLAVDFVLRGGQRLWWVFTWLRQLGWKRIGVMKFANGIHVDVGYEYAGASGPYYFLDTGAEKGTALTAVSAGVLATIPGYNLTVPQLALQPDFGGPTAQYSGDTSTSAGTSSTPSTSGRDIAIAIILPVAYVMAKIMGV